MKVWELEEGKIYKAKHMVYCKIENSQLKSASYNDNGSVNHWYKNQDSFNTLKDLDFKEVVDTNSHWKPEKRKDVVCYINEEFTDVYEGVLLDDNGYNKFHSDDMIKVECLALEFKIKSVLLNWRRLHDNVELDWVNEAQKKWLVYYPPRERTAYTYKKQTYAFGYFSSEERAEQFYNYMKGDIDKYFEMKKELKF